LQSAKPGANVLRYLDAWEKIGGAEAAAKGLMPRWKDPVLGPLFCEQNREHQLKKDMKLPIALREELLKTCLKDEEAMILTRTEEAQVRWSCPAWVVPKKKGPNEPQSYRRVQDCRGINELIGDAPFKMEDWLLVRDIAKPGVFATSLDFKSAFNLFPIDSNNPADPQNFAHYHCFKAGGIWWRPVGMLFGAKHSPYFFTQIVQPIITHIRRKWVMDVIIYMDDMLLLHEDADYLRRSTEEVASLLLDLGIILSLDKCEVEPKQQIHFLGWKWDFQQFVLSMTKERRKKLTWELSRWISLIRSKREIPIRKVQGLVGELAFLRPQMTRVLLYLRPFYSAISDAVAARGQRGFMSLPYNLIHTLRWFSKEIHFNTPTSLRITIPQGTLVTDASEVGCGAILQVGEQEFYMFERFQPPAPASSNQREMYAVLRALKHFLPILQTQGVSALTLESDNMTVVHNVLKVKAQEGPLPIVKALFSFMIGNHISLIPIHRPGIQNDQADALSRLEWMGDYEIKWELVTPTLSEWNITPTIDLFATAENRKLPLYCSADPSDRQAYAFNAFSLEWARFQWPYIHVTPALIPTCLQRIQVERIWAIIVAPMWPSQPWWDGLKRMTRAYRVLGRGEDVLSPGKGMRKRETKLPPGWMEIAIISHIG
jgi:ribonuclease HI